MILANKVIKLRKQFGWSQEELADQLGVSRQSVSKWESAQSIPDLNKIVRLADIFGVSTDFLLKDEVETAELVEGVQETKLRQVNLEASLAYLNTKAAIAQLTIKGVALCVCSPVPLFFFLAVLSAGQLGLTPGVAATLGILGMLVLVAIGVGFLIRINRYSADVAPVESERFELSYGVHGVISEKMEAFHSVYSRQVSLGVGLFILSVVPFLAVAILSGRPDMTLLMLGVMFFIITAGLNLVIPASTQLTAYKLLLSEGDRDAGKSQITKNAEKLGAIYWPFLTAIYLGWSLWTMQWGITWIIWPVGSVVFIGLLGFMGLLKKEKS